MLPRHLFHRPQSVPEQPLRRRRLKRTLRVTGVAALSLAGLLLVSTSANLILEGTEKSHTTPYGEKVHINEGTINVARSGHTGPVIVLISGLGTPAPALDFAPLIRELNGFQTVVVEGFGYGHSDMTARPRTVENITDELHEVLSKLAIKTPYILAGHSVGGFYTLSYASKYPKEVSAVIGIDPTVPASKTTRDGTPGSTEMPAAGSWAHIPSTLGLIRWATVFGYGAPGGDGFTSAEREQMRQLTSWNFGNQAVTDETLRMGENAAKLQDVRYPDDLPVLDFLSRDTMNQQSGWLGAHQDQLANVKHHELVVLNGEHYLHWTQSKVMAQKIRDFLSQDETK